MKKALLATLAIVTLGLLIASCAGSSWQGETIVFGVEIDPGNVLSGSLLPGRAGVIYHKAQMTAIGMAQANYTDFSNVALWRMGLDRATGNMTSYTLPDSASSNSK